MFGNFVHSVRERWYFLVRRYFEHLDWKRISRNSSQYEADLKAQAVVANIAGEKICADSGMCASKNWNLTRDVKAVLVNKFESTTRERHDEVTGLLMDLSGKPIPPPIEGVSSVLNVGKP